MMKNLFGTAQPPPPPPKTLNNMSKEELRDQQRGMQRQLNKEIRELERQVMQIDMARKKSEADLQKEIKKPNSDKFIKQTYARQVLTCQKNKERILVNKGQLQGLGYSIDNMFANIKMAQTMGTASNVMRDINKLMNIKEMSGTMAEMQKEMMKMGIMNEMMDDAMENISGDVDLGDMEQQAEQLILNMEKNLAGPSKQLNIPQQQYQVQQQQQQQEPMEDDFEKRLQNL